jgi:hypothetical protein
MEELRVLLHEAIFHPGSSLKIFLMAILLSLTVIVAMGCKEKDLQKKPVAR